MQAIFDPTGRTVAWLKNEFIFSLNGKQVLGHVRSANVWSVKNEWLGFFISGFFRDQQGDAVAFVKGAHGGPSTPVTKVTPSSPVTVLTPVLSIPGPGKSAPTGTNRWSAQTWESFIKR